MVRTMAEASMSAEADGLCGADYGTIRLPGLRPVGQTGSTPVRPVWQTGSTPVRPVWQTGSTPVRYARTRSIRNPR